MFEYVELVSTFLKEMDPETKQMITGAVGTVIGMVAKPVSLWGWRTSKCGAKKSWAGIKWCLVDPPLSPEAANVVERVSSIDGWVVRSDVIIIHPDGDAVDLEKRTYRRHGINLTKRFAKHERKAIMKVAKFKLDTLLERAEDNAMPKVYNY